MKRRLAARYIIFFPADIMDSSSNVVYLDNLYSLFHSFGVDMIVFL